MVGLLANKGTSFGDYPEIAQLVGWAKWLGTSLLIGALIWGAAAMAADTENPGRHLRKIIGVAVCGAVMGGVAALVDALI